MWLPQRPTSWRGTNRRARRDANLLLGLVALLLAVIALYDVVFLALMAREGKHYSIVSGLYWTLQTMTTLGYGDITFSSDAGRVFSLVVLATGVVTLFVLLPFTLIQVFYAPWLESRNAARAPRDLSTTVNGHCILTAYGPVEAALIERLDQFRTPYVVIVPKAADALALHDQGVEVMVGPLDSADTYRRARVEQATLVAATQEDTANATIALAVRECSATVPLVATASWEASVDTLRLAGVDHVVQLGELLGRSMARRLSGRAAVSQVVGSLDDLVIAEAAAADTTLVGHTLRELALRDRRRMNVAAVWERGKYLIARPDTRLTQDSQLLLCGTRAEFDSYDREMAENRPTPGFVLILGGGRIGRATSRHLTAAGVEHSIVERSMDRVADASRYVFGDATDPTVLERAGLGRATGVAITTHDDDVNVYLTLHCRRLRPHLSILSRATSERNVMTLYRAGADSVLSYVPMEATAIFRAIQHPSLLLVVEGLDVFSVPAPPSLAGRTIGTSRLREDTGCNILAVREAGARAVTPEPGTPLTARTELILIADRDGEKRFFARYGASR